MSVYYNEQVSLGKQLIAPFPWFGGKRKISAAVWQRFGRIDNYVEPFFGSGAVLLNRPAPVSGPETVNDKDGYVANFWRAIQACPDEVSAYADQPVNENDLHARHVWLLERSESLRAQLEGDRAWYHSAVEGWRAATDLITDEVLKRYQNTPDPRLREIMLSLIKHIHSFAKEVKLSASEWAYAMQLLEETGKFCGPGRNEFMIFSDALGLSMLTVTPSAASAEMTGSTRSSSSATGIRGAPGRVDSPPTSTRSAPCAVIATSANALRAAGPPVIYEGVFRRR